MAKTNVNVENKTPEVNEEVITNVVETPSAPVAPSLPATEANANRRVQVKETQRRALVKIYLSEKKIPVTISPLYAPYLGKVVPVLVNGIRVDIPADGRTYQINSTHASEIIAKIRRIDNLLARQKKAGDVSNNVERNIGELKF